MKLATWRRDKEMTQAALAALLGCSQSYVSQMERVRDPIIPAAEIMGRIHIVTDGRVEPNDFYQLPAIDSREAA